MKKEIVNYLLSSGMKPHLKGFRFLHRAIELTIENNNILPSMTKVLYPQIAKEFNESISKVERSIRNSIYTSKVKNMSNSEFIALAAVEIELNKINNEG